MLKDVVTGLETCTHARDISVAEILRGTRVDLGAV
jgi:hypothetical protein